VQPDRVEAEALEYHSNMEFGEEYEFTSSIISDAAAEAESAERSLVPSTKYFAPTTTPNLLFGDDYSAPVNIPEKYIPIFLISGSPSYSYIPIFLDPTNLIFYIPGLTGLIFLYFRDVDLPDHLALSA
jgi:hypothetical protein